MDLELIATHARLPMLAPDATARELVSSAAGAFAAEQIAAPAIVALRRHVFDALDSELVRLASKSSPPEQSAAVAEALRHFAGALLHDPTQRARELAAGGRVGNFEAGLAAVFGIDTAAAGGSVIPLRGPPTGRAQAPPRPAAPEPDHSADASSASLIAQPPSDGTTMYA